MKLKDSFITQDIDGTQFLVAVGESSFITWELPETLRGKTALYLIWSFRYRSFTPPPKSDMTVISNFSRSMWLTRLTRTFSARPVPDHG